MRSRAGIIGAGLLGWALTAHAYTSPYSSMAVAGGSFTNPWSTTPNLVLMADHTWVGTQQVTAAGGEFKFTANGSWTINWGGGASIARVPASATAPVPGGGNLSFGGLTTGLYRFTFNDSTLEFFMEWAGGSPLPIPFISSLAAVGSFNNWTAGPASTFTNHTDNTNLWSRSLDLEEEASFLLRINGSSNWGAAEPTTLVAPVSNIYACGDANFTLTQFDPGSFFFLFNASNTSFSITQTSTTGVIAAMAVLGNFIATNNPPPNMDQVSSTRWESTHDLTNNGAITVRFSGNYGARIWGATNATPIALPAAGTLATGLTAYANVSGATNGRYRITFDHLTGAFTFRQLYTAASGINLIQNPGFETTTNGYAASWNGYQSYTKTPQDGVPPHSGGQCGAVHAKQYTDWTDYSSYSQDVDVETGKIYRASAWVRVTPTWSATIMQIKMEWRTTNDVNLGNNAVVTITPDTTWQSYVVEGTPPAGAARAHVVILCSGTGNSGYMCVDDVEVRQIPPREQTFDEWGTYSSMGPIDAPDGWSATSGKTIYNVPPGRPAAQVFISQYVEGTGNNKAVEIFNGTLSDLDLSAGNYVLKQYNNGSLTANVTMSLSGTLNPGACLVVARPGTPTNYAPDPAISGVPILLTNKYLTFNGDDVIILLQGTNVIDRVGQVGTNATGSIWSRSTQGHTLTRKSTVYTGTLTAVTATFPLTNDWDIASSDNFDNLGTHAISYTDPNEPYTPAGFSLLLDTNATLMSGELLGGIGDISFWYRTESPSPPIDLAIEVAEAEDGPWTTNVLLSGIAESNFHYAVTSVNSPSDRYVRFRHVGAGTNRFRLDEIVISPYSSTPRIETFVAWTLPTYVYPGTYSRLGWTIENASISTNSGSRAALLSPPSSAVISPSFDLGVGEVVFWASPAASNEPAFLSLQSSEDGGTTWMTQNTFTVTSASTYSTWLYLTNSLSLIKIGFDLSQNSGDALVDDIEIRLPALYRNQDFNTWPAKASYTNGVATLQGWKINSCLVDSQEAYEGNSARLSTTYADAWIQSPYLPDGIGSIRFQMKKTTTVNPVLAVEVSPNEHTWIPIATVTSTVTGYTLHSFFYSDTSNHFVRFRHSAGNTITPVDNIAISTPQPRPEVGIFPALQPEALSVADTPYITADVVTRYGASILSVTGYYRINTNSAIALAMAPVAYGSYASTAPIPAQIAGTMIRYYVQVQYAGIGAAPASTGYSTNLTNSVIYTTNYVGSIPRGDVWINEISYYATLYDPDDGFDYYEDHEFVELCGLAGTTVSNWSIQLAFGSDSDIAKNGGTNIYASYAFTNTFGNSTNGFGFYVLGDSGLTKVDGNPIDRPLTTFVPASVAPSAASMRNHMHNSRGVIRLLDEYNHLVYMISYGGSASGATPSGSQSGSSTNSVSLRNSGSTSDDFSWGSAGLTIGGINAGQTLIARATNALAAVFHIPSKFIDSSVVNTNMRAPVNAAHSDTMNIYYGFAVASSYGQPAGTIYYRTDSGTWKTSAMTFKEGSQDSGSDVYTEGSIPAYTNARGSTLQYVIDAQVSKVGITATFIGAGTTNDYQLFDTLDAAKSSPFSYTYAVPTIYATSYMKSSNKWVIVTDGNDPIDPFKTFKVYSATSLFVPLNQWQTNIFTTTTDYLGQITFIIPTNSNWPVNFYRYDPTW